MGTLSLQMTTAAAVPNDGAGFEEEARPLPDGANLLAGGANVIMQLSALPVGRGVAESRVVSGRVDRHPFKRARTTLTYLAVATAGTADERLKLRREIDLVHAQVHSLPGDDVEYDAFDVELQLWVAACLYWGAEDMEVRLHGHLPSPAFYRQLATLGTTLQVPENAWPADREAFEQYWRHTLANIRLDDITRHYLHGIARANFLPFPLDRLFGPLSCFVTLGLLPAEFRRELRLPWDAAQQRRFDRLMLVVVAVNRRLPRIVRQFPFNALLRDARSRWRRGRTVI